MEYKQIEYYPLSQDQTEQLIHMIKKEECPRTRNRAHAILLLFGDHMSFEEIASILRVHPTFRTKLVAFTRFIQGHRSQRR